MSHWRQTGPSRWIVSTIHSGMQIDDPTIIDLFNTDCEAAPGNPATTVEDVDVFHVVETDHDTYELEMAVTVGRRYDNPVLLTEGLDTP
jgi:hypothetical protein